MNLTPRTTPKIIQHMFPSLVWEHVSSKKEIYLTFDDGPTPEITEWTLKTLKQYNAKATFFCIGNNVEKHPDIFNNIINEGHSIGNHTHHHVKGWGTKTEDYLTDVSKAKVALSNPNSTKLFRPPYGQIRPKQVKALTKLGYKIIMWSVLSIDWDKDITKEQCLKNVIQNTKPGSIIVFHDSIKAAKNMQYALPKVLDYFSEKGFEFKRIPEQDL